MGAKVLKIRGDPGGIIAAEALISGGTVVREVVALCKRLPDGLQIFKAELVAGGNEMTLVPFVPVVDHNDLSCPGVFGKLIGDLFHLLQQLPELFGREIPNVRPLAEGITQILPTLGKSGGGILETRGGGDKFGVSLLEVPQKPLALLERIVTASTKEGDLILDPFMGSGTTGVASVKLGRKFVGIDVDKQYVTLAEKRILDVLNNKPLL